MTLAGTAARRVLQGPVTGSTNQRRPGAQAGAPTVSRFHFTHTAGRLSVCLSHAALCEPFVSRFPTTRNMPKARTYKCTACMRTHAKPTGKRCPWVDMEQIEEVEDSDEPVEQEQVASDLAEAVKGLMSQMEWMGKRMAEMEKARSADNGSSDSERREGSGAASTSAATAQPDIGSAGIPSVQELRRDYEVGREVNRRLAEMDMADGPNDIHRGMSQRTRGKRSGAAKTVQDTVVRDIDWPHFHIYSPPGTEAMTYERLSIQEFTYGYLQMVDQPGAKFDRGVMWDLLKAIMEDAVEYPWSNVRNFFWIVGSQVELGRTSSKSKNFG